MAYSVRIAGIIVAVIALHFFTNGRTFDRSDALPKLAVGAFMIESRGKLRNNRTCRQRWGCECKYRSKHGRHQSRNGLSPVRRMKQRQIGRVFASANGGADGSENTENGESEESPTPLEEMLERARKRPSVVNNPIYALQAWLDGPFLSITNDLTLADLSTRTDNRESQKSELGPDAQAVLSTVLSAFGSLTRGDVGFASISWILLHAKGFAIGLIFGRLSLKYVVGTLRERLPLSVALLLIPTWPAIWGIILDQII